MADNNSYEKVRFIGYPIPTAPADIVPVGDPNGTGAVAGTYRAEEDFDTDIAGRAEVIKNAVDTARAALPDLGDPTVLNIFIAPEFFWHGPMGPYVHKPTDEDPAQAILRILDSQFPAAEYPHFLLICGTVITAQVGDIDSVMEAETTKVRNRIVRTLGEAWTESVGLMQIVVFDALVNFIKNTHGYPEVEVRNRALMISSTPIDGVLSAIGSRKLTTEKGFDSNEDFLLWEVTGKPVITEPLTAYPVIDLSAGDFKVDPFDPHGIFTIPSSGKPLNIGVEVCLDHSDVRLRATSARSPWPENHETVDLHLIPSCGMQLHPQSIAARAGGWAFNTDGQYPLGDPSQAGTVHRGDVGGVPCTFVDYVDVASPSHGGHTQLAQVRTPARLPDEFAPGAHNPTYYPATEASVDVVPVTEIARHGLFYAGGSGAVHIYGKDAPLPLQT